MTVHLPDIAAAASALARGEVVLMPTDTLPGLHARVDRPGALALLNALKGRGPARPLLVLASSAAQAADVAVLPTGTAAALVARCWPGPFSFILQARDTVDALVTAGTDTVAVRVPGVAWLRELVEQAGRPVASTSVNRSGETPAIDLDGACAFAPDVAVFRGPRQPSAPDRASAVVDLLVWPPRVLRDGPVALPDVESLA